MKIQKKKNISKIITITKLLNNLINLVEKLENGLKN